MTQRRESDSWFLNGKSLSSGNSLTKTFSVPGADRLTGLITRSTNNYDVDVEWYGNSQDASTDSPIHTESVASNVSGGTTTEIDEDWHGITAIVKISDAGSGSGSVDANLNIR